MRPNGEHPPIVEGHPDTRPYLTIPYWSTGVSGGGPWDTGAARPLPGSVVSYLAESIHTSPYTPGELLEVVVDVRNSGGGSSAAVATVVVYWADPSTGFAKPKFFAASSVAVPPTRTAPATTSTPVMRATIPASAPTHICLLVMVSHPQDPAGKAADPVGDRHWAQRNLVALTVAPGAPALLPFVIGNPFARADGFTLIAGPADERHLETLEAALAQDLAYADATLRLLDADGAEIAERGGRVQTGLELGALEERSLQLFIEVGDGIGEGQAAPFEIRLLDASGERIVGSLGVVVTG